MPVTFAHPLAVIPLKRIFKNLSYPALICGSCGPDIELFIPFLNIQREWSHSLGGVFATSVPLAILLYLLFDKLFRRIALDSLPWQISVPYKKHSMGIIILSILLGALTHVFWDSFTHEKTFITNHLTFLNTTVFTLAGHGVAVSKILQYISSIGGTALVALYTMNRYRSYIPQSAKAEWFRLIPFTSALFLSPLFTLMIIGLPESFDVGGLYSYLKPVLTTLTVTFFAITAVSHRLIMKRELSIISSC